MLVTIESNANGFVITDELTSRTYVATKIDSYLHDMHTVVAVLKAIENESKPKIETPEEN